MSRPRSTISLWTIWAIALLVTCSLWTISHRWNVCYAGDYGFVVVTNGYLILPVGGTRTWGDWGWWVQAPWPDPMVAWSEFAWPLLIGPVPQMGTTGVYLPFATCYGCLILWPLLKLAAWIRPSIGLASVFVSVSLLFYALMLPVYPDAHSRFLLVTWIVTFMTASLTLCDAVRNRRRNRPGSCAHCSYDLTGNASGVCPECGESTDTALLSGQKTGVRGGSL
ncbi:MAG: hypothetical protein H6819_10670 [Phycisphaerales bacterium]|nr:hypothetical protein [Phycisphaerales bacterium]MCB9854390.1 hypothetical protein [Phycisphaerales bacterium]MCB9863591.1 hypothetical protein [Phycisphaerales bacterium]